MTLEQLSILKHAVGYDARPGKRGYRNRYYASGDRIAVCEALVALGMMAFTQSYHETHGDARVYRVSRKGCMAIGLTAKEIEEAMG